MKADAKTEAAVTAALDKVTPGYAKRDMGPTRAAQANHPARHTFCLEAQRQRGARPAAVSDRGRRLLTPSTHICGKAYTWHLSGGTPPKT
jgi:hypothetical protein